MSDVLSNPGSEFKRIGAWREELGDYRGALAIPHTPDGRVLLQMRDDIPDIVMPGKWGFFGGGIDPGETAHQAVVREIEEELGICRAMAEFKPAYAVLTGEPRWGILHIFTISLELSADAINVREGGGFALATRKQAEKLDLIPYIRPVLEEFWSK